MYLNNRVARLAFGSYLHNHRLDIGKPLPRHRLHQAECRPHIDNGVTDRARATHTIFCNFHMRIGIGVIY